MKEKIEEFLAPYIVTWKREYDNIFGVTQETGIRLIGGCSLQVTDKKSCEFEDGKLIDYGIADYIVSIDKHCRYEYYHYSESDWEHISEYGILIITDIQSNVIAWLDMETFQIHKQ